MKFHSTSLERVMIIEPRVFSDTRGFFLEIFHQEKYKGFALHKPFVQDNHSHSIKGVIRGLHYQLQRPQDKLIYVVKGTIFDVAVDIRQGSPTFKNWIGMHLSDENHRLLYIPEGFAHGFCVLSDEADVIYKCTDIYMPQDEYGIRWDDQELAIDWPMRNPLVSDKDGKNPFLSQIPSERLPYFKEEYKEKESAL